MQKKHCSAPSSKSAEWCCRFAAGQENLFLFDTFQRHYHPVGCFHDLPHHKRAEKSSALTLLFLILSAENVEHLFRTFLAAAFNPELDYRT